MKLNIPPRTAEAIRLTALGYTHKDVAHKMGINSASIDLYKVRFKDKVFKQHNRSNTPLWVALALREGLVTKEELIENLEGMLK